MFNNNLSLRRVQSFCNVIIFRVEDFYFGMYDFLRLNFFKIISKMYKCIYIFSFYQIFRVL